MELKDNTLTTQPLTTFTIANATFPQKYRQQIEQQLVNREVIDKSLKQTLLMRYGHKSTESFFKLVSYMCEATFTDFWIAHYYNPNVVNYFARCKFDRLQALDLREDDIVSIEVIAFFDMPHLRSIYLSQNKITQSKALTKTHWKQISYVSIAQNLINDLALSRFLTNQQNFDKIYYEPYDNHQAMMQDISILLKIKARKLNQLIIEQRDRIRQYKVMMQLMRKYQRITFQQQFD